LDNNQTAVPIFRALAAKPRGRAICTAEELSKLLAV